MAEFEGTIGRTFADSTPWWPPLPSAPDGRAQRRHRAARRRRLRAVRLLRLRHRHADLRPARRRRPPLRELPHHRAVLADPGLPADRPQPPLQRHGPRRRAGRRLPRLQLAHPEGERLPLRDPPRRNGYATFAVGKWHLSPATEMAPGSRRDTWPLGRGFERYYGFMGGETDQYRPELVQRQPPGRPAPHAGGGLPPHRGPGRPRHPLPEGPAGGVAGPAVLPLVHARAPATPRTRRRRRTSTPTAASSTTAGTRGASEVFAAPARVGPAARRAPSCPSGP